MKYSRFEKRLFLSCKKTLTNALSFPIKKPSSQEAVALHEEPFKADLTARVRSDIHRRQQRF